jgi:hypothetical protein
VDSSTRRNIVVDAPHLQDVQRLAAIRAPWCTTVYGAAAAWSRGNRTTGPAGAQIREVLTAMKAAGASAAESVSVRDGLREIAARGKGEADRVDHRARSVGLFVTPASAVVFAFRTQVPPRTSVADRFLVAPLLEGVLAQDRSILVLAVSERDVRLVDVTGPTAAVLTVPGLPHDLRTTIALDLTGDRGTLGHLRTSEDPKLRLREYARAIDRAVAPVVRHAGAVLLIAAAEPLAGIMRAAASVPVLDAILSGNHDGDPADDLADLAMPVITHLRRAAVEQQLDRLAELDRRALVLPGLEAVEAATREGAVDTLLIDLERRLPPPDGAGADRVDELVRAALATGTTIVPVHADDLPTTDPVVAVLRYARADRPAPVIG